MRKKNLIKRAQSRGFARALTMLTLMLTFEVTGAWAQENEGWLSGITNGDFSGDDVSNFFKKLYPSTETVPVVIDANAGKDGTPGIVVKTATDENAEPADYDSQFFIVLPEEIPAGTTMRVQFDYKASKAAKASTECHAAPQSHLYWNAIGEVNFTTDWKTFDLEFTVPKEADGMKSIAFNLQKERTATDYYFDNFNVLYKKSEWTNIIVNSDMEGTDVSCFYVKEQGGDDMFLPRITEGIGMDGSRAIKVQSSDNEPNSWDTQFFIRLPYVLPPGTMYRLSYDYKADKAGDFGYQVANEPNQYIWWTIDGYPAPRGSFTTKWQHYKKVFNVPNDCDGVSKSGEDDWLRQFRTIYANLSENKVATEFIFDNVKVEILNDVLSKLTPEPVTDPELMIMAPPYTVTLAKGTEDATKWTITPTEATTPGVDKDTKVTLKYSGTREVKSIMAVLKAVNTSASAEEATVNYALSSTDVFTSGQTVDVKNGNDVVATITYGEAGGTDFKTPKIDSNVTGYTVFTEGNGTNGDKTGGTFYTIVPAYDGTINVAVVLNADKAFYILEDGTALTDYNGITVAEKYYGTYSINVSAGKSYKIYCAGSKLGFYGFEYIYTATADTPTEVALTPTENANEWTFTMPAGDIELEIEYNAISTGIESISSNTTINNAKAAWYNISGQRVAQPTKGLFIKDGKKVVIK